VRQKLELMRVLPIADMKRLKDGDQVRVAGLITVRQRPGTAKGVLFMTLEDESGNANLVVWEKLFNTYRKEIVQSRLLMAEGKVQIEGEVIHLVVQRCFNLTGLLSGLTADTARGDETTKPVSNERNTPVDKKTRKEVFYKGRNFR